MNYEFLYKLGLSSKVYSWYDLDGFDTNTPSQLYAENVQYTKEPVVKVIPKNAPPPASERGSKKEATKEVRRSGKH